MNIELFFNDYRNIFLPVYADYVALTQVIPEQVLVEIGNAFSHLSQYYNNGNGSEERDDNLSKAHGHLIRTTLDLHKMVWAEQSDMLKKIIGKSLFSSLAFNISDQELKHKYSSFQDFARKARRHELENVGIAPHDSIQEYDNVCKIGFELIESIDKFKLTWINSILIFLTTKEFLIGLLIGLFTEYLASKLF